MDTVTKQQLLEKMAQQYRTMDSGKEQELLNKKAHKYKWMDAASRQEKYWRSGNKNIVLVIIKL